MVYQLNFFTPGINPSKADFLKHILHILNNRIYPRGLPHNLHLFLCRTANLGVLFDFSIIAFLAIARPQFFALTKGMPKLLSNNKPSLSFFAVVWIVIFNPPTNSSTLLSASGKIIHSLIPRL